jgi:hypothetical protein
LPQARCLLLVRLCVVSALFRVSSATLLARPDMFDQTLRVLASLHTVRRYSSYSKSCLLIQGLKRLVRDRLLPHCGRYKFTPCNHDRTTRVPQSVAVAASELKTFLCVLRCSLIAVASCYIWIASDRPLARHCVSTVDNYTFEEAVLLLTWVLGRSKLDFCSRRNVTFLQMIEEYAMT